MVPIRRATLDDAEAIARIHEAAIRAIAAGSYTPEEVESWAAGIKAEIYTDGIKSSDFLVAGEPVIGFGSLDRASSHIWAVFVHPAHSRRGVGSALMEELGRIAHDAALDCLTVSSSLNAVPFYEAHGFTVTRYGREATRGGVSIPCAYMVRNRIR